MAQVPDVERRRLPKLRAVLGILAVLLGIGLILVVVAVGHCSSFGGRCPSDPPPLWDDDVFGSSFVGAFIASAVPTWLAQPTFRRLRRAVPVGLAVGFIVGLIARGAAAG